MLWCGQWKHTIDNVLRDARPPYHSLCACHVINICMQGKHRAASWCSRRGRGVESRDMASCRYPLGYYSCGRHGAGMALFPRSRHIGFPWLPYVAPPLEVRFACVPVCGFGNSRGNACCDTSSIHNDDGPLYGLRLRPSGYSGGQRRSAGRELFKV